MIQKLRKRTKSVVFLMVLLNLVRFVLAIPVTMFCAVVPILLRDLGRSFRLPPT